MAALTPEQYEEIAKLITDRTATLSPLSKEQREEVEALIENRTQTVNLSSAQKWDVAAIVGKMAIGVVGLLGVAGYFAITNAARDAAITVKAEDTARVLIGQKDFVHQVQSSIGFAVPGVVVAFDTANGCPEGWTEYENTKGRMIVGVGQGSKRTRRGFEELGGNEQHTLTVAEMPAHAHGVYPNAGYVRGNMAGTVRGAGSEDPNDSSKVQPGVTTTVGGGNAFEIMPPFIALYYCKKA